jgi:hypothetical protein
MSFLRRAIGGDKAPEWASFMSGDEYRAFAEALESSLTARGWRSQIADNGSVVVDRGGGQPEEFGLYNLAQVCHQLDRSAWPATIQQHFTNLAAAESASNQLSDFAYAEPMLKVRVYRASEMPPEALAGMVTTPVAPDLVGVLVADLPTTVQTLGKETVAGWNRPIDELFAIATRNLAEEAATFERSQVDLGNGARGEALSGNSFFVGSQIIRLKDVLGDAPHGALVIAPTRHILIWHPIAGVPTTVQAVNSMIALASNLFAQGPGSVTPALFWWHGALSVLPAAIQGNSIQFAPPDEFVELLNSLS